MVSGLDLAMVGDICVVFLSKTLYPRSASLHQGVSMDSSEFNVRGNPGMD